MSGVALFLLALAAGAEGDARTVVVDERSGKDATAPATVVGRDELARPGATWREVLTRQPGLRAESLGGAGSLTQLRIRGSTPDQVRLYLDGVALRHADGSPVDLSDLPLWSAGALRIWKSHAPLARGGAIGGTLELTSRAAMGGLAEAAFEVGAFDAYRVEGFGGYTDPELGHGFALGLELAQSSGRFPFLNDHGTLFDPADDTLERRRNQDLRRVSLLGRGRLRIVQVCDVEATEHVLADERGLGGTAVRPALRARYQRAASLTSLRAVCGERGSYQLDAQVAMRWQASVGDDPGAELSLVPTHAERDAWSPSGSLTWGQRVLPWLRVGAHGELAYQAFELRSTGAEPSVAPQRASGAMATEVGLRIPVLDLEVVPRFRLDLLGDPGGAVAAAPTWQLALAYRGLEARGLHASVAAGSAVRQPNLYELYGDGAFVKGNPALRAERATTVATALAYTFPWLPSGGWLRIETAAFFTRGEDLIQMRRSSQQTAVADNLGTALLGGLEIALGADLFGHLRLRWGHASLWTENLDPRYPGRPLPLRPEVTDHARLEAYLGLGDGTEARVFFDVDHLGAHTFDPAALVRAEARTVLSAGLGARIRLAGLVGREGTLELGVVVRNLLDAPEMDVIGYPLPGRSFAVRVGWRESGF